MPWVLRIRSAPSAPSALGGGTVVFCTVDPNGLRGWRWEEQRISMSSLFVQPLAPEPPEPDWISILADVAVFGMIQVLTLKNHRGFFEKCWETSINYIYRTLRLRPGRWLWGCCRKDVWHRLVSFAAILGVREIFQKQETKKLAGPEHLFGYPLINIQQTMENHLFSWENSL